MFNSKLKAQIAGLQATVVSQQEAIESNTAHLDALRARFYKADFIAQEQCAQVRSGLRKLEQDIPPRLEALAKKSKEIEERVEQTSDASIAAYFRIIDRLDGKEPPPRQGASI